MKISNNQTGIGLVILILIGALAIGGVGFIISNASKSTNREQIQLKSSKNEITFCDGKFLGKPPLGWQIIEKKEKKDNFGIPHQQICEYKHTRTGYKDTITLFYRTGEQVDQYMDSIVSQSQGEFIKTIHNTSFETADGRKVRWYEDRNVEGDESPNGQLMYAIDAGKFIIDFEIHKNDNTPEVAEFTKFIKSLRINVQD